VRRWIRRHRARRQLVASVSPSRPRSACRAITS
jgi:hypothetical protein